MLLPEPTYHGNPSYDLWLLMRLLYTTFILRLWWFVPFGAIIAWEFYLRHEKQIKRSWSTFRGFARRALGWVPYPKFSPVSVVSVRKAKARKAVA